MALPRIMQTIGRAFGLRSKQKLEEDKLKADIEDAAFLRKLKEAEFKDSTGAGLDGKPIVPDLPPASGEERPKIQLLDWMRDPVRAGTNALRSFVGLSPEAEASPASVVPPYLRAPKAIREYQKTAGETALKSAAKDRELETKYGFDSKLEDQRSRNTEGRNQNDRTWKTSERQAHEKFIGGQNDLNRKNQWNMNEADNRQSDTNSRRTASTQIKTTQMGQEGQDRRQTRGFLKDAINGIFSTGYDIYKTGVNNDAAMERTKEVQTGQNRRQIVDKGYDAVKTIAKGIFGGGSSGGSQQSPEDKLMKENASIGDTVIGSFGDQAGASRGEVGLLMNPNAQIQMPPGSDLKSEVSRGFVNYKTNSRIHQRLKATFSSADEKAMLGLAARDEGPTGQEAAKFVLGRLTKTGAPLEEIETVARTLAVQNPALKEYFRQNGFDLDQQ